MSTRALIIGISINVLLLAYIGRTAIRDVLADFWDGLAARDRRKHVEKCREVELRAREEKLRDALANAPELASLRAEARMLGEIADLERSFALPTREPRTP